MTRLLPALRIHLLFVVGLVCAAALAACDGSTPDDAPKTPSGPPALNQVRPRLLANDHPGLIILEGSGFQPGARVAVGPYLIGREVEGNVTWVNGNYLVATFPAGLPAGDYDVGLTNPNGDVVFLKEVLQIRPPVQPAASPTAPPSPTPTATPTEAPTPTPTPAATLTPTRAPTPAPTPRPTEPPTAAPTAPPTARPTATPATTATATPPRTGTPSPVPRTVTAPGTITPGAGAVPPR